MRIGTAVGSSCASADAAGMNSSVQKAGEALTNVERIIEAMRTSSASPGAEDAGGAGGAGDTLGESALETLRAAARGQRHVKLGYVDKNGRGATLTALPLSVSAGQVDVLDEATDRVVRISLPRITRVVLA